MNKVNYYTLSQLGKMFKMSATAAGKIISKHKVQPAGKYINRFGGPAKVYSEKDLSQDMFVKHAPGTIILNDGTVIPPNNQ